MLNSTLDDHEKVGYRMSPAAEMNVAGAGAVSSASSPGLISVVIVCMTIMAVCALVYFAIRCYLDERRLRASAMLCKCLPPASSASLAECGNSCRYVERRAVHAAVQTSADQPPTTCWPMSDVRTSEARRTGCTFSSPVANNEAVPNWRPPATGSSQRQTGSSQNHYRLVHKSSQRQKHRHHRQAQRRGHYQRDQQPDEDEECYPLRRSHLVNMRPSIQIQSPSSSDSYSVLTMSLNSKSVAMLNKELNAVTFSEDDEDDGLLHQQQYSKSGLSEAHSYVSNPYHPRYNTPVSELNNNDVVVVDIEDVAGRTAEEEEIEVKKEEDDRKWAAEDEAGRLVDGATQSCPSSQAVWDNLKPCQQEMMTASSLDTISADLVTRLDSLAGRMPLKGTFPSCEVLAGGRLINRWTQTDNASLASLDWDNYDCERMRLEVMDPDVEEEDIGGCGSFHRLANVDEGVEGMTGTTSSTTLLMVSHGSADTTLQASRISHRSASSPYVLCFECSEDFSVNDERRASGSFVPRRTSSPPHPRRIRSSAGSPLQQQLLPPSPLLQQSSCHHPPDQHQPDGQDGRSSKAVKPRRK